MPRRHRVRALPEDPSSPPTALLREAWPLPDRVALAELEPGEFWLRAHYGPDAHQGAPRGALGRLGALDALPADDPATWDAVKRFVQDYGLLTINSRHGSPRWHQADERRWGPNGSVQEPGQWYLTYAHLLGATSRAAWRLAQQRNPSAEDVETIARFLQDHVGYYRAALWVDPDLESAFERPPGAGARHRWLAYQANRISAVVGWWLAEGDVRPAVEWTATLRPEERWTGGLWGIIGGELLASIHLSPADAACEGCGRPVRHQLKRGHRVWCRRRACQREAARRWKEDERERARAGE